LRTIAVVNFKGGTGKTTTVVNLGAGLAQAGLRVLLIDADPHAGLTHTFNAPSSPSFAEVLTGRRPIGRATLAVRERLHLLAASSTLQNREFFDYVHVRKAFPQLLRPIADRYDFVLIDCPAPLTPLNAAILATVDEIIIPSQVEYLSLLGLSQVLQTLARIRFPNQPLHQVTDLHISLIVPTFYDVRRRQSRLLLASLRETFGPRVAPPIRLNVRLSEAPAMHQTIFEYAPESVGAFDYRRLTEYFLQLPRGSWAAITLQTPFVPLAIPAPSRPAPKSRPAQTSATSATISAASHVPTPAPPPPPECPYCHAPLASLTAAGYLILACERCGYQKQKLLRDLHEP
jgi:chromosome partitioning protein